MFFYLICNASIGNYQESRKKYLTTFIYGTIIYILLHAFLHTSSSQIAIYLKSYFWIIVGLDCAAMYYLYTYLNENEDLEAGEQKNLKNLLSSFYDQLTGSTEEEPEEKPKNKKKKGVTCQEEESEEKSEAISHESEPLEEPNLPKAVNEPMAYTADDHNLQSTSLSELDFDDAGSDSGSDVDLDKFEMTLQ